MKHSKEHIEYLWKQYISDKASKTEIRELFDHIKSAENDTENQLISQQIVESFPSKIPSVGQQDLSELWQTVIAARATSITTLNSVLTQQNINKAVHRIYFLKTAWFRYAAVLLLIAGTAIFLYLNKQSSKQTAQKQSTEKPDILPGSNKAVLTLSDGTTITLDSAANGTLAHQGNAQIIKLANGQIAYNLNGVAKGDVMINTMRTPRGGQYQLTLPDGTNVWLNAASSITYPAIFVGNDRKVSITGEAYMEVVKNPKKSFVVNANGTEIQVLGTSFNVNAYENEKVIKTTLISGSVKVKATTAVAASSDQQPKVVILKPGQQAEIALNNQAIKLNLNADVDQTLAWKNGLFSFNNFDLGSVMKQFERWYDIQVRYEGTPPDITIEGKMYRNVNLSNVLEFLRKMGVKFRMEGKTLIVEGN